MSMFKVSALAVLIPLAPLSHPTENGAPAPGPGLRADALFRDGPRRGERRVTLQEMQRRRGASPRADADGERYP